jgi:hypothetical protein
MVKKSNWRVKKLAKKYVPPCPDSADVELSDQDMDLLETFDTSFLQNINLATKCHAVYSDNGDDSDEESKFEQKPRVMKEVADDKLPIKMGDRVIRQKETKVAKPLPTPAPEVSESESEEEAEIVIESEEEVSAVKSANTKSNKKNQHVKEEVDVVKKIDTLNEVKEKLATHASNLIEDPENNVPTTNLDC